VDSPTPKSLEEVINEINVTESNMSMERGIAAKSMDSLKQLREGKVRLIV